MFHFLKSVKHMRKVYLMFVMVFLACTTGFAQEPVTEVTTETVFWVDSTANNARMLNKSKFRDNWFIGVHVGSFYSWGENTSDAGFFGQFRPAAALSIGKWLHPAGGFRAQAAYGNNKGITPDEKSYTWHTLAGYLDAMFNLSNIFSRYNENRKFDIIAMIGAGLERTFHFEKNTWNRGNEVYNPAGEMYVALRAGLMAKWRISETLDLNIEAVNNWIDDAYDGQVVTNKYDGHINILAGLTYRFKNHDGSRQFTYATRDMSKYIALNDEINRLKAENAKPLEPEVIIQKELVKSNHIRTLISFENASSSINKLQEVNVYTAAQALSQIKDGDLYITINEDAKDFDVELFLARAHSIREMLVNQLNVPAGHIFIEKNSALVKSLDPEKTCVIMYINE